MNELTKKMKFYSPLRYPGGKQVLFPFVKSLLTENGFASKSYAEPYAGGCGLALKLLFEDVVDEIYLNDFDPHIYAFWITILNDTEFFCHWINEIDISMEEWYEAKKIICNSKDFSNVEIAKAVFFLNRCNISGVLKGGVIGGKGQAGAYSMNARFNKQDLIGRIKKISEKRDKIHFYNLDAIDFLKEIENSNSTFVYLDPPYVQKGSNLYLNFYKEVDHKLLKDFILNYPLSYIISYDNSELVLELYKELDIYKFNIAQSTSNKVGNEIIIFSELVNYKNSMTLLKNPEKIE